MKLLATELTGGIIVTPWFECYIILGVEYNPRMYVGISLFDEKIETSVFQSNIGGLAYMNDRIFMYQNEVMWKASDVTDDEVQTFKQNVLALYYKRFYIAEFYNHPNCLNLYKEIMEDK